MLTGNLRIEPDNELGIQLVEYRTDCTMAHYVHTACTNVPLLHLGNTGMYIDNYNSLPIYSSDPKKFTNVG